MILQLILQLQLQLQLPRQTSNLKLPPDNNNNNNNNNNNKPRLENEDAKKEPHNSMDILVRQLLAQPHNRKGRYEALEALLPKVGASKLIRLGATVGPSHRSPHHLHHHPYDSTSGTGTGTGEFVASFIDGIGNAGPTDRTPPISSSLCAEPTRSSSRDGAVGGRRIW